MGTLLMLRLNPEVNEFSMKGLFRLNAIVVKFKSLVVEQFLP